ncbi:MAG: phosphate acetyltransferase [Kiritimatiellaeota bacterium]|nr:phosphate acetyltransferase [Kiritimatiellota bacterium]
MPVIPSFSRRSGPLPRVVLCESFDWRVLRAAHTLTQYKLGHVVLLGNRDELDTLAVGLRLPLEGMDVFDYEDVQIQQTIASHLEKTGAGSSLDATDPVVVGAWLVASGSADVVIAGAATTPSHVMRVYLKLLGVAADCSTVSGMSLVRFDGCDFVRCQMVGVADVSVVPDPTVDQLADIAIQSAASYERITGESPRLAFLSFSTSGSSSHPAAQKVRDAVALTHARAPDLILDGEMQIDTALIPAVAGIKAPASAVAGNANVLVFPSLDAGNVAIKILRKFSGFRVYGPFLQGMKYSGTYIPRASSAGDIVDQAQLLLGSVEAGSETRKTT